MKPRSDVKRLLAEPCPNPEPYEGRGVVLAPPKIQAAARALHHAQRRTAEANRLTALERKREQVRRRAFDRHQLRRRAATDQLRRPGVGRSREARHGATRASGSRRRVTARSGSRGDPDDGESEPAGLEPPIRLAFTGEPS
jgi:hypothetical protein